MIVHKTLKKCDLQFVNRIELHKKVIYKDICIYFFTGENCPEIKVTFLVLLLH